MPIAIEELSRVDGSVGIIVAAHNSLCTNHIFKFGTEAQRQKYVVPLAQGKKLGCWSLTEPEAGSDAGGTRTGRCATESGWVINGAKTFTTNGHYADVCVAMAVTDPKGHHGISAFIVEKGTPGFRPGKKENKLGMRASDTSEVIFSDCRVPAENLLGEEGTDSSTACRCWTAGAFRLQRWRWEWRRVLATRPRNMPNNANSSAKPSPSFRPSSSNWRTWPRDCRGAPAGVPGGLAGRPRAAARLDLPRIQHGQAIRERSSRARRQ